MRSKSCSLEGRGQEPREEGQEGEEAEEEVTNRKSSEVQREEEEDGKSKAELPEPSRKQLLHLLGVMEGEVQVATPHQHLGSAPFPQHCSAADHSEPCGAAATCRPGAD